MNFSVLMSIYHKEKVDYFNRAMQSIWSDQRVKPTEIILVQDGRLTDELYVSIKQWRNQLGTTFQTIALKDNVGLGDALNIGLESCTNELVARMDTDDISLPDRFEKQLAVFCKSDIDICSSWISEFDINEKDILSYRKLPEFNAEIFHFSKKRNPINHPAVMFKKTVVKNVGGYKKMMGFEDYYLWARMLLNGANFYNIQEPLVNMRAGYGQLQRRSGAKYAVNEFKFQRELLRLDFINIFEFIINIIIRLTIRFFPKKIVKKIYKILRN